MIEVNVIGGGLAGAEAALRIASGDRKVRLYEMRPEKLTPAHKTGLFAELVCSNTLGGLDILTPRGLLKEEMRILKSIVMEAAEKTQVPAGGALAVNREEFSS